MVKSLSQNTIDITLVMEGGELMSESGQVSPEKDDEGDRSAELSPERNEEAMAGSQNDLEESPS